MGFFRLVNILNLQLQRSIPISSDICPYTILNHRDEVVHVFFWRYSTGTCTSKQARKCEFSPWHLNTQLPNAANNTHCCLGKQPISECKHTTVVTRTSVRSNTLLHRYMCINWRLLKVLQKAGHDLKDGQLLLTNSENHKKLQPRTVTRWHGKALSMRERRDRWQVPLQLSATKRTWLTAVSLTNGEPEAAESSSSANGLRRLKLAFGFSQ